MMNFYRNYILPGLVFQSVVIGGGYATGRELIEFFAPAGPVGGVLGLVVAGLLFGVVLAAGFEFARVFKAYDYRHFFRALLGRGWVVYEVAFIFLLVLILSVIGSAAGEILADNFGLPTMAGTLMLMVTVALLTFTGSETIKRVLAGWSFLLYFVYGLLIYLAFKSFGSAIASNYAAATVDGGWIKSGVLYSGYNVAILPAVLFVVAQQTRRRQAVGAGMLAGMIAIVPALFLFVAMMGHYPEIIPEAVPANYLMAQLEVSWFEVLFQIVVFGTFIETGTALLHAINERLDGWRRDGGDSLPRYARPLVSLGFLSVAIFAASNFGIVNLIARGYSALTLVFIAVLVVPLSTVGLWKIRRALQTDAADAEAHKKTVIK